MEDKVVDGLSWSALAVGILLCRGLRLEDVVIDLDIIPGAFN